MTAALIFLAAWLVVAVATCIAVGYGIAWADRAHVDCGYEDEVAL